MRLFIAWSGPESRHVAEVLKGWLPSVLQAVVPFLSVDLAKGSRWSEEIKTALNEATVGIVCVTPSNVDDPWINFEAGALSSRVERTRVCPLLFGLHPTDISGPMSQFQSAPFGRDEMLRVMKTVNDATPKPLTEQQLQLAFNKWWPDLETTVKKLPPPTTTARRSERELLEELVVMVRDLKAAEDERTGGWIPIENFELDSFAKVHPTSVVSTRNNLFKSIMRARAAGTQQEAEAPDQKQKPKGKPDE
jgi:hypothetical protein